MTLLFHASWIRHVVFIWFELEQTKNFEIQDRLRTEHKGRIFYVCTKTHGEGCGFFQWSTNPNHGSTTRSAPYWDVLRALEWAPAMPHSAPRADPVFPLLARVSAISKLLVAALNCKEAQIFSQHEAFKDLIPSVIRKSVQSPCHSVKAWRPVPPTQTK